MRTMFTLGCAALALALGGCGVIHGIDPGPTQTSASAIDAGNVDGVQADVRMNAGTLKIEGGAPKLLNATFRYSEKAGRPVVQYDVTGSHGRLTVESPEGSSSTGHIVNQWDLQMGSDTPLDLTLALGAGESNLDVSRLALRSLKVSMGAGQTTLNMGGSYAKDISAEVDGGVGEARISLPHDTGAEVEVEGGIGSVKAQGLTKRDGKYYNDAYADGKPAVHMTVHGGVGSVILSVAESRPAN